MHPGPAGHLRHCVQAMRFQGVPGRVKVNYLQIQIFALMYMQLHPLVQSDGFLFLLGVALVTPREAG